MSLKRTVIDLSEEPSAKKVRSTWLVDLTLLPDEEVPVVAGPPVLVDLVDEPDWLDDILYGVDLSLFDNIDDCN